MTANSAAQTERHNLADDILEGADAIAEFLLCARKSVLLAFIASQEERALPAEI
ncbi:hypothetical protein AAFG07_37705 [Bradyrhizobium sp. B097]|uniref:hypothetical protein n=1 Tax=Bradyrhizobium sp. B097 TaxID=3140244 RepID=UPI003183C379